MVKNLPVNAGDVGSILGLGRSPGEGNGNPAPVFLPEKSHGQRSLAGSMGSRRVGHNRATENACTCLPEKKS